MSWVLCFVFVGRALFSGCPVPRCILCHIFQPWCSALRSRAMESVDHELNLKLSQKNFLLEVVLVILCCDQKT